MLFPGLVLPLKRLPFIICIVQRQVTWEHVDVTCYIRYNYSYHRHLSAVVDCRSKHSEPPDEVLCTHGQQADLKASYRLAVVQEEGAALLRLVASEFGVPDVIACAQPLTSCIRLNNF